jgi:hypothetical protein
MNNDFTLTKMNSKRFSMESAFRELKIVGPETGDRFFEAYGPGNLIVGIDKIYERFHDYELLLTIIQDIDPKKYLKIHKGTPYYFLGWLAFIIRDYEKAVFYMDSALAEDKRKSPSQPLSTWIKNPAGKFFCLDPEGHTATAITAQLKRIIGEQFSRFNRESKPSRDLNIADWVKRFVHPAIADNKFSFVTSIYSFLLEFKDRQHMLNLKPTIDGSAEPYLVHLFKGGLIFESLMKYYYNPGARTLGGCLNGQTFRQDFSLTSVSTSASSLQEIVNAVTDDKALTAFTTVSKIRNTTGHNLTWDNVFSAPGNYKKLFEQEMNAIFLIISKQMEKNE